MSAQSSGQTPRSSISSQPSASSSVSRKLSKRTDSNSFGGSRIPQSIESRNTDRNAVDTRGIGSDESEKAETRHLRRQRPRTSGGFLLQDSLPLQAVEHPFSPSAKAGEAAKGKHRVEDGKLVIPKRATNQPSLTEVEAHRNEGENGSAIEGGNSQTGSSADHRHLASPRSSTGPREATHRRSLLGPDTDPAAIVNLALSLSESRRRNVSGTTNFGPIDRLGGGRSISGKPQTIGMQYGTSGGSLRQHLQEQRRISRNISPRSDGISRRRAEAFSTGQSKRQFSGSPTSERNIEDDAVFNASDATLARAEKARVALELGYEYRRILQYLPALPKNTSGTRQGTETQDAKGLGRAYNPLQYVRNRKVRFREKKPLNPESDGWKDVDRVRAWINTVKQQSEVGGSSLDEFFSLPSFEAVANEPTVVDSSDFPSATQSNQNSATLSARPKMDWIFAPSDLLADVYWLHQDQNIRRIEDRSWQKFTSTPVSHKFGHVGSKKGSPISPDSINSTYSARFETTPRQPKHISAKEKVDSHERGRVPKGLHQLASSIDMGHGSRSRKSRWSKKLLRSRSSSSSGQSDSSDRSRQHRSLRTQDGFDNAALEKHMMDIINKEVEESRRPTDTANGNTSSHDTIADGPTKVGKESSTLHHDSADPESPAREAENYSGQANSKEDHINHEIRHRRLSSEHIFTAPTSPMIPGLAPSIAIDLSPPESPQNQAPNSTISPSKRPLASRLGSFRRDRSRSLSTQPRGGDRDALKDSVLSRNKPPSKDAHEPESQRQENKERAPVPPNGSLAPPQKNDSASNVARIQEPRHGRHVKDAHSSDNHRRRGFFKGGRIAELVGNEVSKVGEILWRREGNHHHQTAQFDSPDISSHNSDASEDDERDTSALESNPSDSLSRVTTNNSGIVMRSSKAASERQRYYMNNLPSFRSQASDNDQSSTLEGPVLSDDHISRQQRMMKERGRSFKFDRLAPPRIDMSSVSRSPSPVNSRSQSRETRNDHSRGSSGSRSTRGARVADQRLNDMLGIPGRVGTGKVAPTGLAAFSSRGQNQRDRGRPDIKRQWSISDHGLPTVKGTITKRDIARVRALLLSSGIKANDIVRRIDEIPTEPSAFLQRLQDVMKEPIPLIPPSQEFVFAARTLVTDIESTHHQLRDGAESFSTETADRLHNQIKAIDDQVNYKLTPLVRAAADDADAFSTELTTTHTLAVRQLNVSIDLILRRRRRRLRWITRGGWATLEWTVLGFMWVVWFIVMIIRIVRGAVNVLVGTLRWLLFL